LNSRREESRFQPILAASVTSALGIFTGILAGLGSGNPIPIFIGYLLSFLWLALVFLDYSTYAHPKARIEEKDLARRVTGVVVGFWVSLFFSLVLGLFLAITGSSPRLILLSGLSAVWLGSTFLPHLLIGPAYALLMSRESKPASLTSLSIGNRSSALFASCILLRDARRYVGKFVTTPWVSAVTLAYGWYLIFGSVLGFASLLVIPVLLVMSRFLNLPAISANGREAIRAYATRSANMLPFTTRGLLLSLMFFSALIAYTVAFL
jgi:hypothetical protein